MLIGSHKSFHLNVFLLIYEWCDISNYIFGDFFFSFFSKFFLTSKKIECLERELSLQMSKVRSVINIYYFSLLLFFLEMYRCFYYSKCLRFLRKIDIVDCSIHCSIELSLHTFIWQCFMFLSFHISSLFTFLCQKI